MCQLSRVELREVLTSYHDLLSADSGLREDKLSTWPIFTHDCTFYQIKIQIKAFVGLANVNCHNYLMTIFTERPPFINHSHFKDGLWSQPCHDYLICSCCLTVVLI